MQWFDYPITNAYSATAVAGNWDTPHYADDIATPFHTPITALEAGTIKQADYAAWGGEIFIQPDNGGPEYYYYHLDENNVADGQHVNAGDILGLSGGENPGYPGALHPADPQYSTGPHTHIGEWTAWTSGPNGTIPYGPDITPLLNQIKTGQQSLPTVSNLQAASATVAPVINEAAAASALVRIGLFLLLLVLFGGGLYIAFSGQIDQGIRRVVQ